MEPTIVLLVVLFLFIFGGFRYNKGILACGQWGYIGDDYNPKNLEILGLYNQTRGEHSCGVYVDENIEKGIDDLKLFMNFIVEKPLPLKLESGNKVMMGHARQASSGFGHGWKEQHPFHVNNLIGQQNGTIRNDSELAKKYKIEKADWNVDTELMYILLDRVGYEVLEEYTGFAALMWAKEDKPNELWVFRGISPYQTGKDGYYEERPLYYLQEDNGFYFSSMENSLKFIRKNPEHVIKKVPGNEVIRLYFDENGKVQHEVEYVAVRDFSKSVKWTHVYPTQTAQRPVLGNALPPSTQKGANTTAGTTGNATIDDKALKRANKMQEFNLRTITAEKCAGKGVIFKTGRYTCEEKYLNGVFRILDSGIVINPSKREINPPGKVYYFFAGVMMKDKNVYDDFCKRPWKVATDKTYKKARHYYRRFAFYAFNESAGWVKQMSEFAKYPLKVMEFNCKNQDEVEKWYYNGAYAQNLVIQPLFNDLTWYLCDGGLLGKTLAKSVAKEGYDVIKAINVKNMYKVACQDFANAMTKAMTGECVCDVNTEPVAEDDQAAKEQLDLFVNKLHETADKQAEERTSARSDREIVWDRVYPTVTMFLVKMFMRELMTLHEYVKIAWHAGLPHLDDNEVKILTMSVLKMAVRSQKSLREVIEKPDYGTLEEIEDALLDNPREHEKALLIRKLYSKITEAAILAEMENNGEDIDYSIYYEEDKDDAFDAEIKALKDTRDKINKKMKVILTEIPKEFKDHEVVEENEDESDEELTIENTIDELVGCCNQFSFLEQDLSTYLPNGNPKIEKLHALVKSTEESLVKGTKDLIENEFDNNTKLMSRL